MCKIASQLLHGLRNINLVTPEISNEISYVIKRWGINTPSFYIKLFISLGRDALYDTNSFSIGCIKLILYE